MVHRAQEFGRAGIQSVRLNGDGVPVFTGGFGVVDFDVDFCGGHVCRGAVGAFCEADGEVGVLFVLEVALCRGWQSRNIVDGLF